MIDVLVQNPQFLLALAAVLTVGVNAVGMYRQWRLDGREAKSRRISDAAAVVDKIVPRLNERLDALEKDNQRYRALAESQGKTIEDQAKLIDELRYELRAVTADRNRLLSERLVWQAKVDHLAQRVNDLEAELRASRACSGDEAGSELRE